MLFLFFRFNVLKNFEAFLYNINIESIIHIKSALDGKQLLAIRF